MGGTESRMVGLNGLQPAGQQQNDDDNHQNSESTRAHSPSYCCVAMSAIPDEHQDQNDHSMVPKLMILPFLIEVQ